MEKSRGDIAAIHASTDDRRRRRPRIRAITESASLASLGLGRALPATAETYLTAQIAVDGISALAVNQA